MFTVRSGFFQKLERVKTLLREKGVRGVLGAVRRYLAYHFSHKWSFVYLELPLDREIVSFSKPESLLVRVATQGDMDRIRSEIFPVLKGEWEYEKRYFTLISDPLVKCFLAERDGMLVHYSWVFLDAFHSPMMDVPFDKNKLKGDDVYIGPIFTNPDARGLIYPYVLTAILRYLRQNHHGNRVILFVQGKNPAAVGFYKRLGFNEIGSAHKRETGFSVRSKARGASA